MGYSLFSLGQEVRIVSGSFVGVVGTVIAPTEPHDAFGTVILSGESERLPVSVASVINGHRFVMRVPPELLERTPDPGEESGG